MNGIVIIRTEKFCAQIHRSRLCWVEIKEDTFLTWGHIGDEPLVFDVDVSLDDDDETNYRDAAKAIFASIVDGQENVMWTWDAPLKRWVVGYEPREPAPLSADEEFLLGYGSLGR